MLKDRDSLQGDLIVLGSRIADESEKEQTRDTLRALHQIVDDYTDRLSELEALFEEVL
jgi:hypothetical protein